MTWFQYQLRSRHVHFENRDGNVVHKHATGLTAGFFLNSLGIEFDSSCLTLDTKEEFCNIGDKTLKLYVNGQMNFEYEDYEMKDLDKILISYGDESEQDIQKQLDSITNHACEESGELCPT